MLFAPMAGKASNVNLSVRKFRVNFAGHDDHLAGDFLLRIFVASVIALYMAAYAFVTKRGAEHTHRLPDVGVGWKDFEILWRLTRATFLFAFAWLLRAERKKDC